MKKKAVRIASNDRGFDALLLTAPPTVKNRFVNRRIYMVIIKRGRVSLPSRKVNQALSRSDFTCMALTSVQTFCLIYEQGFATICGGSSFSTAGIG